MTSEQLIEKVKKLLELASSPNPHEAALAFSRAQDLISRFSLDISQEQKPESIIEFPYELKIKSAGAKEVLLNIVDSIAKIFSCHVLKNKATGQIRIFGFETNVKIADHAIDCILNQLQADFRAEYPKHRTISFSTAFWVGAAEAIQEKFEQNINHGIGIVTYDKTQQYIKDHFNVTIQQQHSNSSYTAGINSGQKSGAAATIRPGVQTTNGGKLIG